MALLFIDSFDTYATAQMTEGRWGVLQAGGSGSVAAISAGTGRRGTQSLRLTKGSSAGGFARARKTFPSTATWIVGVAYRSAGFPAVGFACDMLAWRDAGTPQVDLVLNPDGTLTATRNGTSLGTTSAALTSGASTFIEWQVVIHPTTGSVTVRFNGATVLGLTGINTRATANSTANELQLGNSRLVANQSLPQDFDDLYVCDGTGSAPYQGFLGDCRVDALVPTSDSLAQWTPSTGTDHYALVDEVPPTTTDYVDSVTVGQIDRFGFAALPVLTSPTVYAVAVNTYAQNPEGGGRQLVATVQSGASTQEGPDLALTNTWRLDQSLFVTDPNGGGAWTPASVNAASFGVKVSN